MATTIDGIVTWLKNWFYDKGEVNNYLNAKANKNLTNANMNVVTDSGGNITTEEKPTIPDVSGFVDTAGTGLSKSGTTLNHSNSITAVTTASFKKYKYDAQGHITGTADVGASDLPSHTHDGDDVEYTSGTSVNDAIDDIYTNALPSKASAAHVHGQITSSGTITSSAVTIASDDKIVITDTSDSNKVKRVANLLSGQIKDANQHTNIGSSANDTQETINSKIDTAIGNLSSIQAIQIVSSLPTASSSTMGKLYIISENSKVNVYYTEQSGSSYSWHKMDTDILDELSVAWNDITGKPSSFTPSSHTHGSITNDGKITNATLSPNASDYILISEHDTDDIVCSPYVLSSLVKDPTAHTNIGSSANDTLSTVNTKIDTALSNKASSTHTHGQLTNDGKITSTAVTVASGDNILITDASDSSKVKRVANLLAGHIKDSTAHTNIGSSANDTQATINSDIDTALSNKANSVHTHNNYVTSIALVPKATDNTGAITLYYGDEPT